ncbi:MAG: hypothetical protein LQ348_004057 [Seirophora lacunosa]|nr:MAG: hypothetical protein LQ348_004057 [Seirophora lacunosa]
MSYGPLIEIPEGYCFIPSCEPSTSSPSRSPTTSTSTTTIFGPTFTATAPSPILSKRSASVPNVVPMLGTHSLQAFPTDLPVQVGDGPVCIVFCDWARLQNEEFENRPLQAISEAMKKTTSSSSSATMSVLKSTMMSVHRSTITGSTPTTTQQSPAMSFAAAASSASTPTATATATPSQQHSHPASHIVGFAVSGVLNLALLLGAAWLVTRWIRKVRAKLNPHTMGVHRDRAREIWEEDGGKGIPEMGGRV